MPYRPRPRGGAPAGVRDPAVVLGAQPAHEVPRIDEHGAGRHAHPVHGARLQALVVVLGAQPAGELRVPPLLGRRDLPAAHDALPRRGGKIARGAARLAESALDAFIDNWRNDGHHLQVLKMGAWIVVQNYAGVQHVDRIK